MFRKIANARPDTPVGQLAPYGDSGSFIDANNNVFVESYDGFNYIKIGYDNPSLDIWGKLIPQISIFQVAVNTFNPKGGDADESTDIWLTILSILFGLLIALWFRLLSWLAYTIVTKLFATKLIELTQDKPKLRYLMPNSWFVESDVKADQEIAMEVCIYPLYLILFLLTLPLLSNPEYLIIPMFTGVIAIIYTVFFVINYRNNKLDRVDLY